MDSDDLKRKIDDLYVRIKGLNNYANEMSEDLEEYANKLKQEAKQHFKKVQAYEWILHKYSNRTFEPEQYNLSDAFDYTLTFTRDELIQVAVKNKVKIIGGELKFKIAEKILKKVRKDLFLVGFEEVKIYTPGIVKYSNNYLPNMLNSDYNKIVYKVKGLFEKPKQNKIEIEYYLLKISNVILNTDYMTCCDVTVLWEKFDDKFKTNHRRFEEHPNPYPIVRSELNEYIC